MARKKRKNSPANEQGKGFAQISRVLMESDAYKSIKTLAGAKALPIIICKFSAAKARGEPPICEFTYSEAEKIHGIPRKSFSRGIKELHHLGFLDIEKKGGVREGNAWSATRYRQSERWRGYGGRFFTEKEWTVSEPHPNSSPFRHKKKTA